MTRSQDRTVLHLKHSSAVYEPKSKWGLGRLGPKYPSEAWAALSEVFPFEALVLSLLGAAVLWKVYGPTDGSGLGFCLALALCVLQLFRTKSFVTSTEIVRQKGLLLLSRQVTPLSSVSRGRVDHLAGAHNVGDVVLETSSGELRLRSLTDPDAILERLMNMRDAAKDSRVQ